MIHASVFSGIGGPEVAAAMLGWENAFHCEINPFGRAVLEYWFPESKSYEDITKTDFTEWRGKIDVLTGGFPCQPFSYAGKRGGREDERYLWPEMRRVIDEVRPTWVVGENVAGITTMVEGGVLTPLGDEPTLFEEGEGLHRYELRQPFTIEQVCKDLEDLGYAVQPVLIPAAAVGAPHRRDRIFIIAHASDAYGGDDLRTSGEDEGKGKGKGLSEWHSIWEPGESDQLRPAVQRTAEDSICDGRGQRDDDQQGRERNERDTCSGNTERLCAKERVDPSYTNSRRSGEVSAEIHAGIADGAEPFRNGSERYAADTDRTGFQESEQSGRGKDSEEEGAGMDNRTVGSGRDEDIADSFHQRLSASLQSGCNDKEKWDGSRRPTILTPDDAWVEGTWWDNFPTVSPVHAGNDGLQISLDRIAVCEERNSMDRDNVIIGALRSGKIEVDFETGKIYSTRIRGHEGERVELMGAECNGYIVHTLSFNGVKKQVKAHQVVWIAANGLYDKDALQIDHINRDRKDNRLSNLRLVTAKENIQNSVRTNTGILTDDQKAAIFQLFHEGNMTMREIAEDFGISKSLVFNVVHEFPSLSIPFSKWRTESLKAYGNAIVPQVMYRIFQAIQEIEQC